MLLAILGMAETISLLGVMITEKEISSFKSPDFVTTHLVLLYSLSVPTILRSFDTNDFEIFLIKFVKEKTKIRTFLK